MKNLVGPWLQRRMDVDDEEWQSADTVCSCSGAWEVHCLKAAICPKHLCCTWCMSCLPIFGNNPSLLRSRMMPISSSKNFWHTTLPLCLLSATLGGSELLLNIQCFCPSLILVCRRPLMNHPLSSLLGWRDCLNLDGLQFASCQWYIVVEIVLHSID